jgi:small neutral amino acid transporter SnatA (MarC family)
VLVLTSRSKNYPEDALILLSLALVLVLTYLGFRFAQSLLTVLKASRVRLLTRLMGLIMAALAAQFVHEGLIAAFPSLHR